MATVEAFGPAERARRFLQNENVKLMILALIVGGLGGLAAIAFREAIAAIQSIFFGFGDERFHSNAATLHWWHILLAPAAGGLLIGLIVRFVIRNGRTHGVADVMEASALRGGRMSVNEGIGAFVISALTIGSGASAGREGPVVHFAAALAAKVSRILKLNRSHARTLLGCGVAAGVAASFNAPISGWFFAMEVVIGSYGLRNLMPVVIASVTGTIISRGYFGDFPAFIIPEHEIASFLEFPAFALLGVLSAAVAITLIWSVEQVRNTHKRIALPDFLRPCVGGLAVGLIGIFLPQVMGVGYEATDEALNGELTLLFLIALIVAKTAATSITLGSGFGGGIFSPSLFLGAMVGGAFGIVATGVFPHLSSGHSAYTLVGMGAVAGATLGAPISTIFMVYELTEDGELTIAVMIATVIASQILTHTFGRSFFHWQLEQRGIDLQGSKETHLLRQTRIADVMKSNYVTLQPLASLAEIRTKLQETFYSEVFVVDEEGQLVGTIRLSDLGDHAFELQQDSLFTAIDFCRRNPPVARTDDHIETAIELFETCVDEHIAIVDAETGNRLVGVMHENDVMAVYHKTVMETRQDL